MKNVTKVVALAMVLVMALLTLASCGANFANMEKKLEDEGYSVVYFDEKKLEAKDEMTTAEKVSYALVSGLLSDADAKGVLIATKGLTKSVFVIEYANADDAKAAEENAVLRKGNVVFFGDEDTIDLIK